MDQVNPLRRALTDYTFWGFVLSLALPISLQHVLTSLFQLVDVVMLGQLGEVAVASAALAGKLFGKPRQHFVYLSVHLSRPCWIDGSPLISMIGLSHVEDTFCLYAAPLLVKPRPIE
jgi:hypothetical protein